MKENFLRCLAFLVLAAAGDQAGVWFETTTTTDKPQIVEQVLKAYDETFYTLARVTIILRRDVIRTTYELDNVLLGLPSLQVARDSMRAAVRRGLRCSAVMERGDVTAALVAAKEAVLDAKLGNDAMMSSLKGHTGREVEDVLQTHRRLLRAWDYFEVAAQQLKKLEESEQKANLVKNTARMHREAVATHQRLAVAAANTTSDAAHQQALVKHLEHKVHELRHVYQRKRHADLRLESRMKTRWEAMVEDTNSKYKRDAYAAVQEEYDNAVSETTTAHEALEAEERRLTHASEKLSALHRQLRREETLAKRAGTAVHHAAARLASVKRAAELMLFNHIQTTPAYLRAVENTKRLIHRRDSVEKEMGDLGEAITKIHQLEAWQVQAAAMLHNATTSEAQANATLRRAEEQFAVAERFEHKYERFAGVIRRSPLLHSLKNSRKPILYKMRETAEVQKVNVETLLETVTDHRDQMQERYYEMGTENAHKKLIHAERAVRATVALRHLIDDVYRFSNYEYRRVVAGTDSITVVPWETINNYKRAQEGVPGLMATILAKIGLQRTSTL